MVELQFYSSAGEDDEQVTRPVKGFMCVSEDVPPSGGSKLCICNRHFCIFRLVRGIYISVLHLQSSSLYISEDVPS